MFLLHLPVKEQGKNSSREKRGKVGVTNMRSMGRMRYVLGDVCVYRERRVVLSACGMELSSFLLPKGIGEIRVHVCLDSHVDFPRSPLLPAGLSSHFY